MKQILFILIGLGFVLTQSIRSDITSSNQVGAASFWRRPPFPPIPDPTYPDPFPSPDLVPPSIDNNDNQLIYKGTPNNQLEDGSDFDLTPEIQNTLRQLSSGDLNSVLASSKPTVYDQRIIF